MTINTINLSVSAEDHLTQLQNRHQATTTTTSPEGNVNRMAIPHYTSYIDYIRNLCKDRPQFNRLYKTLCYNGSNIGAFRILLVDSGPGNIQKTTFFSDPMGVIVRSCRGTIDKHLNEQVIATLKSPPREDIKVRIIVLELADQQQTSSTAIIDALGMIFDVPPAVFASFFLNHPRDNINTVRGPLPNLPNFLRLQRCFVAHVMDWIHESGAPMKIVLILSFMSFWDAEIHGTMFDQAPSIHTAIPISYSKNSTYSLSTGSRNIGWYSDVYWDWLRTLNHDQLERNIEQPLQFVFPWIKYQLSDIVASTFRLRCDFVESQEKFSSIDLDGNETVEDTIFTPADDLRGFVADTLELRNEILKLQARADVVHSKELIEIPEMISSVVNDASHLLEMSAQRQQTFISSMAIREARKSMKEANSVKRLTQLAFVFVPLSYSSSLFGMNINEMTGTGPSLWVFLATSFSLLTSGLCFWYLSGNIQKRVDNREPLLLSFRTVSRVIYAAITTGNFIWMVRSGVLLSLMTKNILGKYGYNANGSFDEANERFYEHWENQRRERKLRTAV